MPTVRPLPVATIFSLRSGGNGVDNSGTAVVCSGIARAKTSVAIDDESERISGSSQDRGTSLACPEETMISETGRAPVERGLRRCCGGGVGGWTPAERRRRNRFAFSRGPASFLRMELRRLKEGCCFGNCSSTVALRQTVRRRADRVRIRLESDNGATRSSDCSWLNELDRDEICGGRM
jgi:hypothetical protein